MRREDPASAVPETEHPNVAVLFFVAHRHVEQRILQALRDDGYEVTVAQGRLAARIGEHGNRLTDLAEQAQVTKQTAGFLVDQLERAGIVQRVADPTDARARLVVLAPLGRTMQARAREVEQELFAEWRRHLGARDWAHLERTVRRLREITDPYADG